MRMILVGFKPQLNAPPQKTRDEETTLPRFDYLEIYKLRFVNNNDLYGEIWTVVMGKNTKLGDEQVFH